MVYMVYNNEKALNNIYVCRNKIIHLLGTN